MGFDGFPNYADRHRRSWRYLLLRVILIPLGFVLVALYRSFFTEGESSGVAHLFVYGLLSAYFVFAVASLWFYRRPKERVDFMRWQVLSDFLFLSGLIWMTGGVVSVFMPLLFITLVAATDLAMVKRSFLIATLATATLTAMIVGYATGLTPGGLGVSAWIESRDAGLLLAYILPSTVGLCVISALGFLFSQGLRRAEGLQSEIIENMAEGLLALDGDGGLLHLNWEARRLLNLESIQWNRRILLRDLLPEPCFEGFLQAVEDTDRRRREVRISAPSGDRYIEMRVRSIPDPRGRTRCTVVLISDLTLKREIEVAERRIQNLEELQVMALGLAHELRNPMASIRGCAQELSRMSLGQGLGLRYMSIICRESDRLDHVIEEFLAYARSGPADLKPTDVRSVVEEAVLLLRSRSDLGKRSLRLEIPETPMRLFGDRNRLLQVLLNLGINAIHATAEETGTIEFVVELTTREGVDRRGVGPGSVVSLRVIDNGCGISEGVQKRMFTPFFTTKDQGNGLGMCIVEKIVAEHYGRIDVRSEEGRGTEVEIWIPALSDGRKQTKAIPRIGENVELVKK